MTDATTPRRKTIRASSATDYQLAKGMIGCWRISTTQVITLASAGSFITNITPITVLMKSAAAVYGPRVDGQWTVQGKILHLYDKAIPDSLLNMKILGMELRLGDYLIRGLSICGHDKFRIVNIFHEFMVYREGKSWGRWTRIE
jgi:hypothetical protein